MVPVVLEHLRSVIKSFNVDDDSSFLLPPGIQSYLESFRSYLFRSD
jgi:hypothetical protein